MGTRPRLINSQVPYQLGDPGINEQLHRPMNDAGRIKKLGYHIRRRRNEPKLTELLHMEFLGRIEPVGEVCFRILYR